MNQNIPQPMPMNERERLESLINFNILEKMPEHELEPLVKAAAQITHCPVAMLSINEDQRHIIKAKTGLTVYDLQNDFDFCIQFSRQANYFEIPDAYQHPEMSKSRMVLGQPNFRYFGGFPLKSPEGHNIGCICVIDNFPKQLSQDQIAGLKTIADQIILLLKLKKQNKNLQTELNQLIHDKVNQTEIDLASYKFALDQSAEVAITDRDGFIKFANDKFCNISGYLKAELLGQPYRILNSGYHSHVFFKEMWQTIQNGEVWQGEIKNKNKNGRFYWVDCQIIPFPDKKGRPHQYVAIQQDITAKKSTLERLKLETALISVLSENAPLEPTIKKLCEQICLSLGWDIGIYWRVDRHSGRMLAQSIVPFTYKDISSFIKQCENFQFNKGEGLVGYVWVNKRPRWIDDIQEEHMLNRINSSEEVGLLSSLVFPIVSDNEVTGVMEFLSTKRNQNDSNLLEMFETLGLQIGSYLERRAAEAELIKAKKVAEESVKSKDQFLTNMSHEIRTPMNAILGFTQLLQQSDLDREQLEFANSVKTAARNLLAIINDILDFSKIESGVINFEETPTDLRELFRSIHDLLKFSAINKNLSFYTHVDERIPNRIFCDNIRLNQILINLVGNAIKFTEIGNVSLNADLVKSGTGSCTIKFSVDDTGIGIPFEKQEKIFDRFNQVNNEINRKYEGTGLGLSISKNLVELMGGKLSLISEEGEGSVFSFELSFDYSTEPIDKEDRKSSMAFNDSYKYKILLIEDNLLNQKLAKNVLNNQGYNVEIADNGTLGLELLKKHPYDLILMDIQMPELDGYQTAEIIREELGLNIPIIAMTAHSILGEKEKCLKAGMDDFISKPFDQEELFKKIENLLLQSEKRTENDFSGISSSDMDLSYLMDLSNGNVDFEKEMISLFVHQVPKEMLNLHSAFNEHEFNKITEISHKLKSSVDIFDFKDISDHLKAIMNDAKSCSITEQTLVKLAAIDTSLDSYIPKLKELLEHTYSQQ